MKLVIENYEIIEGTEIEISGVTILSGKSNNGKSSCFRALQSLCLGQLGDYYVRNGNTVCRIRLDEAGHVFGFKREGKKTEYYLDGKPYADVRGKVPEDLVNVLGIREVELAQFDLAPNFAAQFDPLFMVSLKDTKAAAALSFLYSGEKFPELLKLISKSIKGVKDEVTYLEGTKDQLERDVKSCQEKITALSIYQGWIDYRPVLAGKITRVSSLRKVWYDWASRIQEKQAEKEKVDRLLLNVQWLSVVREDQVSRAQSLKNMILSWLSLQDELERYRQVVYRQRALLDVASSVDVRLVERIQLVRNVISTWKSYLADMASARSQVEKSQWVVGAASGVKQDVLTRVAVTRKYLSDWLSQVREIEESKNKCQSAAAELKAANDWLDINLPNIKDCPACSSVLTDGTRKHLLEHLSAR